MNKLRLLGLMLIATQVCLSQANLWLTTSEGVAVPNYIPLSEDDITHITATATPSKSMHQRFYDL